MLVLDGRALIGDYAIERKRSRVGSGRRLKVRSRILDGVAERREGLRAEGFGVHHQAQPANVNAEPSGHIFAGNGGTLNRFPSGLRALGGVRQDCVVSDISWAAHSGGSAPPASRHSAMGREGPTRVKTLSSTNSIAPTVPHQHQRRRTKKRQTSASRATSTTGQRRRARSEAGESLSGA
jgi:hypothetical protein